MTATSFVDTNVVPYTIGKDARKADIARGLIGSQSAISTQVVNESISVCLGKLSFKRAAAVAIPNQLSHWDALIVASALLAGCDTLYSEDLQHGQLFDEQLTVVNPFRDA